MNHETATGTLELDANGSLNQLENRLQVRLGARIRNFRLDVHDSGIVLRGNARTYHAKQLAQHAVMGETDFPILANEIEVC